MFAILYQSKVEKTVEGPIVLLWYVLPLFTKALSPGAVITMNYFGRTLCSLRRVFSINIYKSYRITSILNQSSVFSFLVN